MGLRLLANHILSNPAHTCRKCHNRHGINTRTHGVLPMQMIFEYIWPDTLNKPSKQSHLKTYLCVDGKTLERCFSLCCRNLCVALWGEACRLPLHFCAKQLHSTRVPLNLSKAGYQKAKKNNLPMISKNVEGNMLKQNLCSVFIMNHM